MHTITISDSSSGSEAKISIEHGFNCYSFKAAVSPVERVEIIAGGNDFESGQLPPSHSGIPVLFPFPNRIRQGRFSWNGRDYELPLEEVPSDGAGNAIHGFCIDRPWRIIAQTADSVTGEFQLSVDAPERTRYWPADAIIRIRYSVNGAALRADVTVINPDNQPLPWGFGTHAYFRVPLSSDSQPAHCTIFAPVSQIWDLQDCLPTGGKSRIPEDCRLAESPYFDTLNVDAVFTNIKNQNGQVICRLMDEHAGLQMEQRCSPEFREIVAFTPPWSSSICLEPYTCLTDAINLQQQGIDAGLQLLPPGQSWTGWIVIQASAITC